MSEVKKDTLCPVCGYELGFLSWDGAKPSFEICPCCKIQFGYDDLAGGAKGVTARDTLDRQGVYKEWRQKWIEEGMIWHGRRKQRPENWHPVTQLQALGVEITN